MSNDPSPLARALRRALSHEPDPLIRNWFAALLKGDEKGEPAASSSPAEPSPKRRRRTQKKPARTRP
jgi:hypothetical protein